MASPNKTRFIGLFILSFILLKADWVQIKKIIQMADPILIGICLVGYLPMVWIKSERWRYILSLQGHHLQWLDSFLIYMSSIYLGLLTPGRLGEFSKVLYLKQHNVAKAGRAFSSVLMDRLLDVYLLIVVAMVGLLTLVPYPYGEFFGLGGIFLAVVIPWSFVGSKKTSQWIFLIAQKYLTPKTSSKLIERVNLFVEDAKRIQGIKLGWVVVMTILSYSLFFFQFFLIAKALSIVISYLTLLQIVACSSLVSMFPITIAGLGTREAVLLYFFSLLGIDFQLTIAFSIGVFFVIYMGAAFFGAFAFWFRPLDMQIDKTIESWRN